MKPLTFAFAVIAAYHRLAWGRLALARAQAPAAAPHRIISLVPAVTEMLFAIGAGPEVVGVSSFDTFPPEVASRPR